MKALQKKLSLFALGMLALATSCKKDSEQQPQVDPTNPSAISSSLTIKDATVKKGTAPAPTNSGSAPHISADNAEIITAPGFTFLLKATVDQGSAKGVYLAVNGADSYFDIAKTNNRSGRAGRTSKVILPGARVEQVKEEDGVTIGIQIPEHIKPGTFCITYCVYDANGQVSNLITRCVEIKEFGGDNKFAGNWSVTQINQLGTVYLPGKENCQTLGTLPCGEEERPLDFCLTVNKLDMSLTPTGAFSYSIDEAYKVPDLSDMEDFCSPIKYISENLVYTFDGAWSYDAATQKLYLIIDYTKLYADAGIDVDVDDVPVELSVTSITATQLSFTEQDVISYSFVKK